MAKIISSEPWGFFVQKGRERRRRERGRRGKKKRRGKGA